MTFNQVMQYISYVFILANVAFGSYVTAAGADALPKWVAPTVAAMNAVGHALPSTGIVMPPPPVIKALLILSAAYFCAMYLRAAVFA